MDLKRFIAMYNNHKLRTENYLTPLQIMYDRIDTAPEEVEIDWDEYGIDSEEDDEGGDEEEEGEEEDLVFYPLRCPLSEEQYNQFSAQISPFSLSDKSSDFIDIYVHAKEILRNIIVDET